MNNLIKVINNAHTQYEVIYLLRQNLVFDFVRNYLMDNYDIDYTDNAFVDEQNILSLSDVKVLVDQAIKASIQ